MKDQLQSNLRDVLAQYVSPALLEGAITDATTAAIDTFGSLFSAVLHKPAAAPAAAAPARRGRGRKAGSRKVGASTRAAMGLAKRLQWARFRRDNGRPAKEGDAELLKGAGEPATRRAGSKAAKVAKAVKPARKAKAKGRRKAKAKAEAAPVAVAAPAVAVEKPKRGRRAGARAKAVLNGAVRTTTVAPDAPL